MDNYKIIAIGDNVCDKYLSRNKMYPGGQCVNTCVFAKRAGAKTAYIGKFGNDEVAKCVQDTLKKIGIDYSRCRYLEGENGFALVTLVNGDRKFLGSNKGGVAKTVKFNFTPEDLDYIKGFDIIYTDNNAFIDEELPVLETTGVPIAYDFSNKWNDEFFARVSPHIDVALLSCEHLDDAAREAGMKKCASYGVGIVLGTIGEAGSWLLYNGDFLYADAVKAENVLDTMGAGDCYFATFLSSMLRTSKSGKLIEGTPEQMHARLRLAMNEGAKAAAINCEGEGAFGYGVPILGRTSI